MPMTPDQKTTFKKIIAEYAGIGMNCDSYLLISPDESVFAVVTIGIDPDGREAFADLIVRLVEDKIIIEEDRNSKILLDALVAAGIPREQIICAYAGEAVPEDAEVHKMTLPFTSTPKETLPTT